MPVRSPRCLLLAAVTTVALVALLLSPPPAAQSQAPANPCAYPHSISWPAAKPVWSLCWIAPNASSGIDGSGVELRHVYYKGHEVLYQAHVPCLNVKYDPGGCGGPTLSYRDWLNGLTPFEANNVKIPGVYAEPTVPPKTVCDHPGLDKGTFSGVAVERRPDRLILTSQMSAGWYRYIQSWTFLLDGTIQAHFGFTAVDSPCVYRPHRHHAYWRLDFDVDGAANNVIEERTLPSPTWAPITVEAKRFKVPKPTRTWRVRNKTTGRAYEVVPGPNDGVADPGFAIADVWALRYHPTEIDDGGSTSGTNANAAHMDKYLNGENINGQDVVLWYRAGHYHVAKPGHIGCVIVGPTLRPVGKW
jgi:hypothetical protein